LNANTTPSAAELSLLRVEAARYALLRRMSSAMRHQLVMHLQPIGMVTEVMGRRLRAPAPDLAQVQDGVTKLNGLSKVAVQSCLDVISWLAPEAGATVPLHEAVAECTELLRGNFGFRGFALRSEVGEVAQPVGRSALRMLLPGALLALSDVAEAPADLIVNATADSDTVRVEIRVQRTEGTNDLAGQLPYRELQWRDVEALAGAEDVQLQRTETGALLTFPVLE
jgi:hypothetical protein